MRLPANLLALIDAGIITAVVRPLMSGKEAQVYLVRAGDDLGVAKIYKAADERTFRHRSAYTEGRTVQSSRDARAMKKGSRYGQSVNEAAWRSKEVDVIYQLRDAGVRVPQPYHFVEGVLIMELVTDGSGEPADRLAEVQLDPEIALLFFELLLQDVVRMTAAGIVHGDLSEYNILVAEDGPVIIDFPQSVEAARNPNAKKLLLRDVDNLVRFISRTHPEYKKRRYGLELWDLYERAVLTPETVLTGKFQDRRQQVDERALLKELADVEREHAREQAARGGPPSPRKGRATDERGSAAAGTPQPRREYTPASRGDDRRDRGQARPSGGRPEARAEGRSPKRGAGHDDRDGGSAQPRRRGHQSAGGRNAGPSAGRVAGRGQDSKAGARASGRRRGPRRGR